MKPCNISHVANFWSKEAGEFIIQCPESSPPYSEDPYSSILTDLQNIFEPNSSAKGAMSQAEETDWATVNLPGKSKVTEIAASTALPSVHMLARPEVLFASQVPYHMILQISSGGISVQGSHQPSLQLLKEYLERYAKIDRNDSYKVSHPSGVSIGVAVGERGIKMAGCQRSYIRGGCHIAGPRIVTSTYLSKPIGQSFSAYC